MAGGGNSAIYDDLMRFKPEGLTPNGWALLRLRAIMDGAPEPTVLATSVAAVAALSMVLGWLVSRRLRAWAT